jgi:hypothetical protein
MCSAVNPVESTACNECGARLVPQTGPLGETEGPRPEPVEGLPFPAEEPPAEQEVETSDWLQQLRASSSVEEVPAGERPAVPEVGPAEPAEEIPDWLKDIRPPEETEPKMPPMAWEDEAEMRSETPSAAAALYPPGEEEPDWLQRLRAASERTAPLEEPTMPPSPPPSPMEVPPAREVPVTPQEEESGPDWLERLRQTVPEEAPPAEIAEAAPPVFEEAVAPPLPVEAEPTEELPDWLQELKPEPEAPPTPAEAPPLAEEEAEELPDWLQRLRPEPEAPPAPVEAEAPPLAVEEEAEELPDWLQRLRPEPEAPPTPAQVEAPPLAAEEEAEEAPDWLKELRPEPEAPPMPAQVEAPPLAVEEEAEEVADWLKELRPEPEVPPAPVKAEPPPLEEEAEEVPDWLKELRTEPEASPTPAEAEAPPLAVEEEAEEIPDWLQRLRPEPEAPPTPAEAEAPPLAVGEELEEEVPEWLKGLGPIPEPEETLVSGEVEEVEQVFALEGLEEEIAEEMPPPVEEAPDWLKELEPAPEGEVPVFKEAEEVPPAEGAPEWLRELGPPQLEDEKAVEVPPAVLGVEMPTGEVPDWLKELGPPVTAERPAVEGEAPLPPPVVEEVGPPVAAEEALEVEGLVQAEIPAWLQELRPSEMVEEGIAEIPGVIEAVETTGLLAGIQGVLPVEPIVGEPHKVSPVPSTAVTVGPEQAKLFREIITQMPAPVTEAVAPRRARIWEEILRRFIYLLIALAVIIPLFGGGGWFGEAELPPGAATDFYNNIQNLPSDSVVLLAFDYDPFTAAEMDRLAEPVLWHLMDRKVKLIVVSLLPTGPAIAGNLLDRVTQEHYGGYQYGQDYVNLGYIPGQAAALNELASDLRALVPQDYRQERPLGELPATQNVNGIQDVHLIIEFAAQQRTLQWWIEQVGSQHQVEIMAAVSAAVEPTATPYHNSGQLVGLISGLPRAAQYEMKTNKWPSLAIVSVDAQSVAHLAILALIVLGSLASLVSTRRK